MKETLHIYTRVSSEVQLEGSSIEVQKEHGIRKSKELGMKSKVWNEGAKSSRFEDLLNRPKIVRILQEIEEGNIKHLFVYNNDRLSRNENTQFIIKNAITKNGVILYTKDGTYDLNNPTDKLMKSLLDGVAEYENAIRAERSRLGKIKRVREGKWYGAPPPYGYKIVDGYLAPHPDESKVVKRIFNWFTKGKSIADIKSILDKEGVLARRGGLLQTQSINRLMQNTHHIGHYTYTDKVSAETISCICPPIVDETIWNNAQEIRKKTFERKGQNNRTKRFYLLRNLMHCGECGSHMSGRIHDIRNERKYFCPTKTRQWKIKKPSPDQHYKRGKVGNHGCNMNKSLNIPITDEFVWNRVQKVVEKSSTLKEGFKNEVLQQKFNNDDEVKQELKNLKVKSNRLRSELSQIQSSIANVETNNLLEKYDPVVYSKISKNLDDASVKKKDEIEQTRIRIKELGREQQWLNWLDKYAENTESLGDYTDAERKEYLEGIVQKIVVTLDQETKDHHLDVIFRLPLVGDGISYYDENNKSSGYQIVDGQKNTEVVISNEIVKSISNANRRNGRKKQNAELELKKKSSKSSYHRTPNEWYRGIKKRYPKSYPSLLVKFNYTTVSSRLWDTPYSEYQEYLL